MKLFILMFSLLFMFGLVSCSDKEEGKKTETEQPAKAETGAKTDTTESALSVKPTAAAVVGDTVTTESGLKYIIIKEGTGPVPKTGQTVVAHYTGMLPDGKKFDSSVDRGTPFKFKLGARQVIKGWDEGFSTMKVGEERRLIIPPDLGYGARGYPPVIPPNSTLIFDVKLLGIE
jgi:FKBP-type peptidyl-prolyl cis-trans isomerase